MEKIDTDQSPEIIKVGFGLPAYNGEKFIRRSLESVLNQTMREFYLVVVDDCSTDNTGDIIKEYGTEDRRIIYYRNQERLGVIANWQKAFRLSLKHNPKMKYFAWVSDNDIWDSGWLETMYQILENNHECVLAYPITRFISEDKGIVIGKEKKKPEFQTAHINHGVQRFIYALSGLKGVGNKIYGLFRVEALLKTDIYPPLLFTDTYLLTELTLYGKFISSGKIQFYKRRKQLNTDFVSWNEIEKQKKRLFTGRRLWHVSLPWWLSFFVVFFDKYVLHRHKSIQYSKGALFHLSLSFLKSLLLRHYSKLLTIKKRKKRRKGAFINVV